MFSLLLFLSILLSIDAAAVPQKSSVSSMANMSKQKMIRLVKDAAQSEENASVSCFFCAMTVDGLQELIKQNKTDNDIAGFLIATCDALNLEQPYVCKHIIKAFQDEVVFVLERTLFTPDEICGAFLKHCGKSENPLEVMWNLTIPDGKPPVKPWPAVPENRPTMKVLHLTDIHIDRQYAVGSEAYCELDDLLGTYALCCRDYDSEQGSEGRKKKPIHVPAMKWGMPYACDLPYQTFDNALQHMSTAHKDLDYIIITGDFEAHDSWDYTEDLTRNNIENVTAALLKYFPKTPVYVSIGNHEGVPQDAMAPHTMAQYDQRGPQWLYSIMKDMWAHWIPTSALPDVQYRASYAIYPKPGLKLISINTIYCSEFNFYLYIDQVDPDATLQWLIEELADSEGKGELVHLISHIPPGADYCLKGWSHNFFEIVHRYENTIAEQFYGHTHQDHFNVYYEPGTNGAINGRPFHFNWISPSITTFSWNNPAYRIYTIDGGYDGATYRVKDADTYSTDLMVANQNNKPPVWSHLYNTRQFYNMTDLSPQSWSDLIGRVWNQPQLFKSFLKNYYRNEHDNECFTEKSCMKGYLCVLKEGRSHDSSFCGDLV